MDSVTDESDTTDNCSASVQVDVSEAAPDLIVDTPLVYPTNEGVFTLHVYLSNTGTVGSAATTLRYYRSTDATITTSDIEVGTDAVEALAAAVTGGVSILIQPQRLSIPPGTYYYGACVDAVPDESDTTNNCSASVTVVVGASQPADLEVRTPTVSKADPQAGGSFTLSATVSNTGAGGSVATTLRVYRSPDATITTSDTEEGKVTVGGLAEATSNESIDLTAPSTAGTYYYGACVDAVTDEFDTTNNCSASVTVVVGASQPPDLEVGTPTVSDAGPQTGGSFTLSATVSNTGAGGSVATTLRVYRSPDATITTSDTEEGTVAVEELAAEATSNESIDLTAPST